jgi:putative ABC transport system permease protein
VRLAVRDLRGGLSGFVILILCIALGTAVIGTVNGISSALQDAIARDGKKLLGGDVEAALVHRQATPDERAALDGLGRISEIATLRTMARRPDASQQTLADLKAVDSAYPLYGTFTLEDGVTLQALREKQGLAVDRVLLDQLDVKVGDTITIGRAAFPIVGVIAEEPDKLAAGPAFGARILMPLAALQKTGLVEPGSLIRWGYRIAAEDGKPQPTKEALNARLANAGFLVRDARDPSPGITSSIKRLNDFLTLVALTAMLTGGIGIANAVSQFVERRRRSIATYKSLGASSRLIFTALSVEIAIVAAIGTVIGLVIAALMPQALASVAADLVPIGIDPGPYGSALAVAALFAALTTLPFVIWPLGRTREVRAAELFRPNTGEDRLPPTPYRIAAGIALLALAFAAIALSQEPRLAAYTCAGLISVFALFFAVGALIRKVAEIVPRSRRPAFALARLDIAGPGSLSRTIALSLGTGLTVLTAVSLVQASLTEELKARLPENAPALFFIGIKKGELDAFRQTVEKHAPQAAITTAPMLRGRIVSLKGTPVEQYRVPSGSEWLLNGDRGITTADTLPNGSEVVDGAWWAKDQSGENLVSFEADAARGLGLAVGDSVTVNVLGRNITARIANLRKVRWASVEINFVMIFSPNTLRQAPFTYLATLTPNPATPLKPDAETALTRELGQSAPEISVIRVRDALAAVNSVFEKIMRAVRLAGSVTLIMGCLVIAGALLSAQRRRIYEAIILRTVGARRAQILSAHLLEYATLALCLSVLSAGLGLGLAYAIVTNVLSVPFNMSVVALLQPSLLQTIFVVAMGTVGTLRVLSVKPSAALRSE